VQGRYNIRIDRDLTPGEDGYLQTKYSRFNDDEMIILKQKLTQLDFDEILPYYIRHYGFYEGRTDYRCDPIAIASIFGLRSPEALDLVVEDKLYRALTEYSIAE